VEYDFDPELVPWVPRLAPIDYSDLAAARARLRGLAARAPAYERLRPLEIADRTIPGPPGAPNVRVRTYRPGRAPKPLPGLIYLHGGGYVSGDLDTVHSTAARIADQVGAAIVAVDYRLAPEHPYPAALEDCYAALEWLALEAADLGVDPARIGVAGEGAGGGLAAALALLARDWGGPRTCFQCLVSPQLDDRLGTVSARSFVGTPTWDRGSALLSWEHYLGKRLVRGGDHVPDYAAPARAMNLAGLPPAFVSVCDYDPLRDEGMAYAYRLEQAGVAADVTWYPGTFHASLSIPDATISQRMAADQVSALRRGLGAGRCLASCLAGA
jgi:acetyl esterase/lipase